MAFQFSRILFPEYMEIIKKIDGEVAFYYLTPGYIFNALLILDILLTHWKVQFFFSSFYMLIILYITDIETLKKILMVFIV